MPTKKPTPGDVPEAPIPSDEELEQRIKELELSRINLRVSPWVFDRLNRTAEYNNTTLEEYCVGLLEASLQVLIGKPNISAPSFGQPIGKKVFGPSPSGQSLVTRA
jgi:hypothetical protein